MHVALNEIVILYGSAVCHSGWLEGLSKVSHITGRYWIIPHRAKMDSRAGGKVRQEDCSRHSLKKLFQEGSIEGPAIMVFV
jgi:hypothetical protein